MEDGRIKDDQITATAHHVDSSAAHFARLNGVNGAGAWCHSSIDKDERDQYLQVSAHFWTQGHLYQNTLYTAFRLFAPLLTNHFSYRLVCSLSFALIVTVCIFDTCSIQYLSNTLMAFYISRLKLYSIVYNSMFRSSWLDSPSSI